ncbi:MAG: radical SAM family heme chaperone HemW [Cryomorphaceae bacterium]|nr:radical SAM family heme chaperone HemW [Cryomorphaceae bacterium]
MAGIYIHIPFCRKACTYCDFHFSTRLVGIPSFVEALKKEIIARAAEWRFTEVNTLYFGGGTPSVLSAEQLADILQVLSNHYPLALKEWTFELNPDDGTEDQLRSLREIGVNRLSVGFQSLRDDDLNWMGRTHSSADIRLFPEKVNAAGFTNYTVDFIYGMPGMSKDEWLSQLQWAVDENIPHLSLYALTVEQKTLLDHWIRHGRFAAPDESQQADAFLAADVFLEKNGFQHYEVSNYGKPGMKALHNSNYWFGEPYMGFGPSAHSFDGAQRRWNVANNAKYMRGLEGKNNWFDHEVLSIKDRINEAVMLGLRTQKGIDLSRIADIGGDNAVDALMARVNESDHQGVLKRMDGFLVLERERWLYADGIASELFCDDL